MNEENMNNENLNEENIEVTEEATEEVAEEITEETTEETTEEVIEEMTEAVEETADTVTEAEPKKKASKNTIIAGAAIGVVVVAIIVVLCVMFSNNLFNKYNRMGYVDVSGKTIEQVADESGYELADFLAEYNLPADMPGNTSESAAFYMIPTGTVAEMYGMTMDDIKLMFNLGDEITEDTPWGEAEGEVTVGTYVGDDEAIAEFKEQYKLGDEVTADTKWKEVRKAVDEESRRLRIEEEKAAEAEASLTEADTAVETEAPSTATEE